MTNPPSKDKSLSPTTLALIFSAPVLVHLPMVFIKPLNWDDWSWFWVLHVEGWRAMADYFMQMSHPAYFPVLYMLHSYGGEYAGMVGRAGALALHLANGILLFWLLGQKRLTQGIALWASVIFLLSPTYYARFVVVHLSLDIALFCYLLSIWLMRKDRWPATLVSYLFLLLSLSHEAVVFLEPLRIFISYQEGKGAKGVLKMCLPYWVLAALFMAVRVLWLMPYGKYAGINTVSMSLRRILDTALWHGVFYGRSAVFVLQNAYALATLPGLVAALIAGGLIARYILKHKQALPEPASQGTAPRQLLLGLTLIATGSLPFVLIGRAPWIDYGSRIALVPMPGVAILLAALVFAIKPRLIRGLALSALLVVLSLSGLQASKWYAFESILQRDLTHDLKLLTDQKTNASPIIRLNTTSPPGGLWFANRFMRTNELAVPLNLLRDPALPPVFVFSARHPAYKTMPEECTITDLVMSPCPEQTTDVLYQPSPKWESVNSVSIVQVMAALFSGPADMPDTGSLLLLDNAKAPVPYNSSRLVTNSLRPGGDTAARMLGLK